MLRDRYERIKGHGFCINPERGYKKENEDDRKEFVRRADNLFDIEEYLQRLSKNVGDMDAIKDLAGIAKHFMVGTPEENESLLYEHPYLALEQAESLLSYGTVAMAKYVENNRKEFLDELEGLGAEHLYKLFLRTSIYKRYYPSESSESSGSYTRYEIDDKEYERVRGLKEKIEQMQRASQEGRDIESVVQEELGELIEETKKTCPEQYIFIMRNQHLVVPSLGKSLVRAINEEFGSLFKDKDGKLDGKKIRDYLEDNYKVVEDFIECEVPREKEEERLKYWDDNLKMQYLEIARELFKPKKKEERLENKNPEVKEKEERKQKAKKLGFRT